MTTTVQRRDEDYGRSPRGHLQTRLHSEYPSHPVKLWRNLSWICTLCSDYSLLPKGESHLKCCPFIPLSLCHLYYRSVNKAVRNLPKNSWRIMKKITISTQLTKSQHRGHRINPPHPSPETGYRKRAHQSKGILWDKDLGLGASEHFLQGLGASTCSEKKPHVGSDSSHKTPEMSLT